MSNVRLLTLGMYTRTAAAICSGCVEESVLLPTEI